MRRAQSNMRLPAAGTPGAADSPALIDGSTLRAAPAAHNNLAFPVEQPTARTSVFLDSSLPTAASGADVYTRQFYNAQRGHPQRRFFPVRPL